MGLSSARAAPADVAVAEQLLGDLYAIEREVGHGSAARVLLARDHSGARVAIKVLHADLAASLMAQRFLEEISVLRCLEHPRICRILDYGTRGALLFYVMPYVEGPTLRQHLVRVGRMTPLETVTLCCELLEALGHAHDLGIVHRDVKPENIKLSPAGVVLMDFGIARAVASASSQRKALTLAGYTVGTPAYMSPEQAAGAAGIDQRSDLYAVGCVAFECLAGAPPFTGRDLTVLLTQHQIGTIPDLGERRADVPDRLSVMIAKGLAKAPGDRWQTAAEMRAALGRWEGGDEVGGPGPDARRIPSLRLVHQRNGEVLAATGYTVVIGRDAAVAQILIHAADERHVSGRHAEIRFRPDGTVVVRDLGSTNGTWLNGRRLKRDARLKVGDRLLLGGAPTELAVAALDS